MNLDDRRDKIRHVEHLSSAWIKHGGDEHTIVEVMRDFNALMKKKKTTKAEELLDQLGDSDLLLYGYKIRRKH